MKNIPAYSSEDANSLAIKALTFVVHDESHLPRFLDVTGWTPASLSSSDSQSAILVSVLEYLMSEDDILLTFATNAGVDPGEIPKALGALQNGDVNA